MNEITILTWLQWELESESFLVHIGGMWVRIIWNCEEWNSESRWCMIPIPHIYVHCSSLRLIQEQMNFIDSWKWFTCRQSLTDNMKYQPFMSICTWYILRIIIVISDTHSTTTTTTATIKKNMMFIFLAGYIFLWSKSQEARVKIFNCSVCKYTQGQSEAVPCENGFIGLG